MGPAKVRGLVADTITLKEKLDLRGRAFGLPEGASLYDRMTAKGASHGI